MKLSKRIQKTDHTKKKQTKREEIDRDIGQAKSQVNIEKNRPEEDADATSNSNNSSFVEIEIEPSEYNVDQRLIAGKVCDLDNLKNEDRRNLSCLNGSSNSPNCLIQQHNQIQEQTNLENGHQTEHEMQKLFAVRKAIQDQTLISTQQQEILINLLNCPLCLDVFKDPVYLKSCLHRICRDCIEKVIRVASIKRCPVCRQEIGTRRLVREDDFLREIMKIVVGDDVKKFNDDIDEIKAKQVDCRNQRKFNGSNKEEQEDKRKGEGIIMNDQRKENNGFKEEKKIEEMKKKQNGGIGGEEISKQELNVNRNNNPECSDRLIKLQVELKEEADSITGRLLLRRRRQAKEDEKKDNLINQQNETFCDNKGRCFVDDRSKCKKASKETKKQENNEEEQEKKQERIDTSEDNGIDSKIITRNNKANNISQQKQSGIIVNISKDSIFTDIQSTTAKNNENNPKSEKIYEHNKRQPHEKVDRSNRKEVFIDKTTQKTEGIERHNQSNKYEKAIKKKGRIQKKIRESLRIQQIRFDLAGIGRTLNGKIQRIRIRNILNPQQQQIQLSQQQ